MATFKEGTFQWSDNGGFPRNIPWSANMDFLDAVMAPRYQLVADKARGLEEVLYERRGDVTLDDLRLAVQILAYDVYALAAMSGAVPPEEPMPVPDL